jgi:hypothetical protein
VLRACGPAVLLMIAGCAITADAPDYPAEVSLERDFRVERVAKAGAVYTVYRSGFVKIEGRGTVRLYRERSDDLLILIPRNPDGAVRLPQPAAALPDILPVERGALGLENIGTGLPRVGQWRERFALARIDARAGLDIVTAPARKTARPPHAYGFDPATGWSRLTLPFPARNYDYGSAVSGDFDADGTDDIALAMHLHGFAAFLATPAGLVEQSFGLPSRSTPPLGTGRVLLTRPQPAGDRLLVLRETMFSGPGIGLQELEWRDGEWHVGGLDVARVAGDRMALSSSTRCGLWLGVADAGHDVPRLWRHEGGAWTERPPTTFPTGRLRVGDLAFGDFDGDGCDDLAVAYSPFGGGAWHASIDVFLARDDGQWARKPVWQKRQRARPTALGFLPRVDGVAGAHLAVLEDDGGLRMFSWRDDAVVIDLDMPAPDWRAGCAGVAIAGGDVDGDGTAELLAAFAGEPSSIEPRRCRNGGGLDAWKPRLAIDHVDDTAR